MRPADIAVVYYAGHMVGDRRTNYLIPVDARLASDRDADDEAIPLERMVSSADGAKRLAPILDACRDNPFVGTCARNAGHQPRNFFVRPGPGRADLYQHPDRLRRESWLDGRRRRWSAQPVHLGDLKNLPVPGLDVRLAFGRVRDEVLKITANRQEPFVYGSLGGGTVALVPAPAVRRRAPSATSRRTMIWSKSSAR